MHQPALAWVPQYWELGACSLLLACLLTPSTLPPGLVGEGSLALRGSLWEESSSAPLACRLMGAACLPPGRLGPVRPSPLVAQLMGQLPTRPARPGSRGFSAHPTTPTCSLFMPPAFPPAPPSHLSSCQFLGLLLGLAKLGPSEASHPG